jgi:hypothetical protein
MLAAVQAQVDDSPGWSGLSTRPHDYEQSKVFELYQDALEAWRKNPIAWRIIQITTDYLVGDGFQVASPLRSLDKFIQTFWFHPENMMQLRLPDMSDELSRSGDLFVLLFRNPADGMSYIRFITKDRILKIETAPNDWEAELAFYEMAVGNAEPRKWLGIKHPGAASSDAILLHYSINRPLGALLGESDLTTMIPWLMRYSRMLEDRVRLHWAVRAFLWVVTVPANRVREKQEQYRNPPEAGSIVIKDEGEKWEVHTPSLGGIDASRDLQAVRMMIDAGSGYPSHWRGEAGDANLATATAMQGPTERHLARKQKYFIYIIQDILYQAYLRQVQLGLARTLPKGIVDYSKLFEVTAPDVSRQDNNALSKAAQQITAAMSALAEQLPRMSPELARHAVRMAFHFAGQGLDAEDIEKITGSPIPDWSPPADDQPGEGGAKN